MAFTKEDWWMVDAKGRKIGWLFPEDFESILESVYGPRLWMKAFAEDYGFTYTTILRWKDGTNAIPKSVAQIVSMRNSMKLRGVALHALDAEWLPYGEGANARHREPVDAVMEEVRARKAADASTADALGIPTAPK